MEPHDYRIYDVNIDLRHHCGISVAESQTFLRAKRPQRRRSRRNGCFRRLYSNQMSLEIAAPNAYTHSPYGLRSEEFACKRTCAIKFAQVKQKETFSVFV